jgi:predicted ATPase/class 3 adenylate cyclase
MPAPPTGTITFVFTDIEGSSQRWEKYPEAMALALAKHDTILREAFESRGGLVFKTIGDAFCVAFDTAQSALNAVVEAQRLLRMETWDDVGDLRVRMALHTGAAEYRDNDYFGQALNRVSRILSAGHGGQTLLSLAAEALVRDNLPEGVRLRHLGEHRLRDLARPEQIYQLTAHDLPSDFPPLRSLENVPNNLPIQLTGFIGREREMDEAKRLLEGTHLLTLTGTGGTGKTRLSLQVAADLFDKFPDGVWLVEFAAIADPTLVTETVASALDVRQEPNRLLATTLASYLRSKNLLLIFDNCEHVVTACARLAETLLRTCPHLRILASSREPLGIAGEKAWSLPALSMPDRWRDIVGGPDAIERLTQYEAVRLFIERAIVARPAFSLTNENAPLIAQICWRLDGLPLAIELAAARTRVLTLQQIAERLDDRFHLLTTGSRTAEPRQQTLRSLIDWSHDLLSESEKRLLRRLSVFARGRTLEAIEAVCAGDGLEVFEIVDLLTQLVDKSLVTVEKSPEYGARYFMLESLWEYTAEKLKEAGETERLRERHLDYFLKYSVAAEPRIIGAEQREWLARMELEEINLRFAAEASLDLPGQVQKGLMLLAATARFVEVRGLFKKTRGVLDRLLDHPDAAPRNAARARALAAAGRLAWVADDPVKAHEFEAAAHGIFRELDDAAGAARALANLALHAMDAGDMSGAESLAKEAAQNAETLRDPRLTAHVRHVEATIAAGTHDFARAFALSQESFSLFRELGDLWMAGIVEWTVGISATVLGRFDEGREHFATCLQGCLDLGNHWGVPYPIEAFGVLALAERQYERGATLLGAAEALRASFGLSPAPTDHPALLALMAAASEALATPEAAAARDAGRRMSSQDAIALALGSAQ